MTYAFGMSVALRGNSLAVGKSVWQRATRQTRRLGLSVPRNGTTWIEAGKLIAPDSAPYDSFGSGVSIARDRIEVGARGVNVGSSIDTGSAYLIDFADCNLDGVPNDCEWDADLDSVPDSCDLCPGLDDKRDDDTDGVATGCDNYPTTPMPGRRTRTSMP